MSWIRDPFIVAGFLLLTWGGFAGAEVYTDPSGFSFTYPDGWFVVPRSNMGQVKDALPPGVKAWMAKNNFDFSRISVVLVRVGEGDFLENLNVVVEKQQIPVNDNTIKEASNQYAKAGAKVENFQGRVQQVASRPALVMDYQVVLPGTQRPLRQRQALIPGGGKTYMVTCTALPESFEQHRPTFETILASFQAPPPVSQGFDWNQVLVGGMVGAVVGGLVGLFQWLFKKKKPAEGTERTQGTQPG
jgi:hypothetical protein